MSFRDTILQNVRNNQPSSRELPVIPKFHSEQPFTNSTAASAPLQPSAYRSIGESLRSWSRAFRFSTLRSTTNPGAMLPGLFFDAWSSIRCFPDFPNPFSTPIRVPGIFCCKRRNMPRPRSCC
jgi:hypothetical protein